MTFRQFSEPSTGHAPFARKRRLAEVEPAIAAPRSTPDQPPSTTACCAIPINIFVHLKLHFDEGVEIRGPLVIGAGRHCGLGLFAGVAR